MKEYDEAMSLIDRTVNILKKYDQKNASDGELKDLLEEKYRWHRRCIKTSMEVKWLKQQVAKRGFVTANDIDEIYAEKVAREWDALVEISAKIEKLEAEKNGLRRNG